ncbi:hypothetical protein AB0J86_38490 [Micromonospora sp. NPDC049559]|uniref:hypothetical protein n=1 Tax=Micromonospora sp. NPDC049559 TaxID=3155923 RepID=UPI00344648B6
MTVVGVLLLTAVVWAVSLIRSVRARALVYSLPLPTTLALVGTDFTVDGAQLLGVVGLTLFFLVVTVLHHRFRWHILLADLAGVAGYVALSAGLLLVSPVPFAPVLLAVLVLWTVAVLSPCRRDRPATAKTGDTGETEGTGDTAGTAEAVPRANGLPPLARLLVILAGAIVTVLFGQLLRGMVVTFPYSGVLVAVETRRTLPEFSRHFARNSIALVAFMVGYYLLRDGAEQVALAGAWAAFAVVATALHLPRPRALRFRSRTAARREPPPRDETPTARREPPPRDETPTGHPGPVYRTGARCPD